ncbi:MAG: hypothetical protein KF866_00940 [Phycisphaeraceae bacterium]|nr:hypothetical protein [Phycisphaeraceae bacterium]MCW5755091.1 hypothetical protein [Phycisphaeraceae bacterium]
MDCVVSPYFLTTREPPVMAALLFARQVVTMMPTPGRVTRRAVADAVSTAPRYLDLMESWRWSMPLWKADIIAPVWRGEDAAEDVRAQVERIAEDDTLNDLRPFMHYGLYENEQTYLNLVARDVLRGGPDPGVSVPVAAGMDAFAGRHGLWVARSWPVSVAQKLEASLGATLGAVAAPMLTQAPAEAMLTARRLLGDVVGELGHGFAAAAAEEPDASARLARAAARYASAFEEHFAVIAASGGDDEVRVVRGMATLTVQRLPLDAVLRSSLAAARTARASGGASAPLRQAGSGTGSASTSALLAPPQARGVVSLVVKVLGRSGSV